MTCPVGGRKSFDTIACMAASGRSEKGKRSALSRNLVISEVLDKATGLFAAKGYENTSLQDIADVVGVSRSALYHYVHSKEQLLEMLVEQVSASLAEVLEQMAARQDLSARDKLRGVVGLLVTQRAEHPDQFRILDRSENSLPGPLGEQHLEAKRTVVREIVEMIEAGVEAGEFKPVDARVTALSLLGMCNWVAWWFRPGSDVEPVVSTISGLAEGMLLANERNAGTAEQVELVQDVQRSLNRLQRML